MRAVNAPLTVSKPSTSNTPSQRRASSSLATTSALPPGFVAFGGLSVFLVGATKASQMRLEQRVGEEMEKTNDRDLSLVGYGAPVISKPGANETDYRHGGDPISMFDRGAKTIGGSINPIEAHSYTGFSDADNKDDASS